MAEDIRMDSHKLIYHPEIVVRWLKGENIYPIELEIGLTNACNHRCIFCAVDYTGYKPDRIDSEVLIENLKELAPKGVKSIIYAGEGEPLLHREAPDIINRTKRLGIDAAISTNGVLLTREVSRECLKSLTWIRFSVAGITDTTYDKIQQGRKGDLSKVLSNMQAAADIKREQNLHSTLGVCCRTIRTRSCRWERHSGVSGWTILRLNRFHSTRRASIFCRLTIRKCWNWKRKSQNCRQMIIRCILGHIPWKNWIVKDAMNTAGRCHLWCMWTQGETYGRASYLWEGMN